MLRSTVQKVTSVALLTIGSAWSSTASAQFPYQGYPSMYPGCQSHSGFAYQSRNYGNAGFNPSYSSGYAPNFYGASYMAGFPSMGSIQPYPQLAAPNYNYYSNNYGHDHSHHGWHLGHYLLGN